MEGYLRDGRARLEDGYMLGWTLRPGELLRLRVAVDVALAGPDTAVDGRATLSPVHLTLTDTVGRAGPGLLRLAPGLRLDCDNSASLDVRSFDLSRSLVRAAGGVDIAAGTCRVNGVEVPLPAIRIVLEEDGDAARAVARTEDGAVLASLRVTPGRRAMLRVEPAGAVLVPGMPSSAPTMLDIPF